MRHAILSLLFCAFLAPAANAEIRGETVEYQSGDTVLKGYIAYDDAIEGKRPGVLVVHEWWGLNDYVRERARMLAELGYTALAVDMYGDGKTADHPDNAKEFATAARQNWETGKARFMKGLEVLHSHASVDPGRTAAIGYCFGGSVVLDMARAGADLDAVASFHGGLGTGNPATPGQVKARVLVLTGAADPMVPAEQVAGFKKEMEDAGAEYRVVSYEGAKHSFTNPAADEVAQKFGMPVGYDPKADEDSWEQMKKMLEDAL
jgi:dienelactone hydrolase